MTTMRGMVATEPGGIETLRLVDLPIPVPASGELLVRVKALGLNPLDTKVRKGYRADGRTWPHLLGWDVAGVVEGVGDGVTRIAPGDEVFYCADITASGGSADYHVVNQRLVARKPATLTFVEAASLPLVVSTAHQTLGGHGRLTGGETLALFGAAGGVGGVAVMIARSMGAKVVGVCSGQNVDYVRSLGADEVIDYTTADPVAEIARFTDGKGAEVVLDTVGGRVFPQAVESVAPFGRLLFLNAFSPDDGGLALLNPLRPKNVSLHGVMLIPGGGAMAQVAEYVDKKVVTPYVNETFPLERMADGHRRLETGHGRGKVVIDMSL